MAHKILKIYLPAIAMSFMAIILLTETIKWISEKKMDDFGLFIFEVAGYLILTCIMDELIGLIHFKTYISHFLTESMLIYPITVFFIMKFKWVSFNAVNLVFCSVVYFMVMIGVHVYFYYMERKCVAEMNRLIEGRKEA